MILAESDQIYINNEKIEGFCLERGQTVQMSVPNNNAELTLIDGLTNKSEIEGLKVYDTFIFVHYISNNTSILDRLLNRRSVLSFVERQLNYDTQKAIKILEKAKISEDWVKNKLAGTPRRILAVLLALESHPNIVYTNHGMDPVGVECLQQLIAKEIEIRKGAAIEIMRFQATEEATVNATKR